jgi:hypothetical protein
MQLDFDSLYPAVTDFVTNIFHFMKRVRKACHVMLS